MSKKSFLKISQKLLQFSLVSGKINNAKVSKSLGYIKSLPKEKAILVLKGYIKLLKSHLPKTTAEVITAIPLSTTQKKQTQNAIGHLKFEIGNWKFLTDPSLLGGIRVKIGDVIYDNSLSKQLQEVGKTLIS